MKFADLPKTDQPNYRIQELGPQSLATSELLAVAMFISESETATELAALYHEYGSLVRIPREKILTIKGLSNGYANAIKAIWELGRREANAGQNDRPTIHSPSDAANLVMYDMSALEQEEMRVIMLDTRNRVIRIHTCYRGSLNSAQVRIGELFKEPIRNNAAAVVVVHNHPSGATRSM